MNRSRQISYSKILFIISFFVIAAGMSLLAPKAAVNVDEQLHYPHAKKVVNWYFTGGKDQSCLNTPRSHLKFYGQSVDNITALLNRVFNVQDEFLLRHYTGAFFFLLLLLFSGLIVRRLTGSWVAATFCMLALVFMPRLSGQAFGNLKDIPFATGYIAGIFFIIKYIEELPEPAWLTALLTGIAIAFTVSVRSGGYILFAFLGLFFILFFVVRPHYFREIINSGSLLSRLLLQGLLILVTGYFGGLLFWPYGLQDVWHNPIESLRLMEHYDISIRQIFEGESVWSTNLPWYYLPEWIIISTPVFVLTGFLIFIGLYARELFLGNNFSRLLYTGVVFFSFLFPFIYVIAIGSNLYSGVRQMLFILPPMTILSVWGIYNLLKLVAIKQKILTRVLFILFVLMLVWPFKHQVATFPADYVYFNIFAGSNKNAWGEYEYDYYFHGIKKPVDYLIELAGNEEITVAMNCNLYNYFSKHPNIKYKYTRFHERSSCDWDYGLFGINYIHPLMLKNDLWKPGGVIKIFYHSGNPVAILLKRTDKSDLLGINEIKKGNFEKGVELLETALGRDNNNLWLYVNLANAKLRAGDITGFYYYLNKGKEIFPLYEPFLFFEAKRLLDEKKDDEAQDILNRLLRINPFYKPAKELYKDIMIKSQ